MKSFAEYIVVAFLLLIPAVSKAAEQIQVLAQVDTSEHIYAGQSFQYRVVIDGDNQPGRVDLSPLSKYHPRSAGNRDVSKTSISIINGRTTRKVVKRFVMAYSLTVNEPGPLTLPPVSVTIDEKEYRTNPVQVNILKPGTTDRLDLKVTLSENNCFTGQPIILTCKFYVSTTIGNFQLNLPVLNNGAFEFDNPDIVDPSAQKARLSGSIVQPVFVTKSRVKHRGRQATLLSFQKVMIPKRPGEFHLAPSTVSADVQVGLKRSFWGSNPEYQRFMVKSEPISLTIQPLPEKGKPKQFYGLVGQYSIAASAQPLKVYMGDPITLTIKIGGVYLKSVRWPALEEIPELAANFKIPSQHSSPEIKNGMKVFTQTIRAGNDRVTEIPSIPLAYFDARGGEYVVAKTQPIKLEVAQTKVLTGADLEGRRGAAANRRVQAIQKGLSANYETLDVLENRQFSPAAALISPVYIALWASPLGAFVISLCIKFFANPSEEKIALRRKCSASARAIKQLRKIDSSDARNNYEILTSIMRQYIAERFDKTKGSLTSDDCREVIYKQTGEAEAADSYRDIIAGCEAARYAAVGTGIYPEQVQEVIGLIRRINKSSKLCRKKQS